MSTNYGGSTAFGKTQKAPMSDYDKLPKSIRRFLQDAPFDLYPTSIGEYCKKHGARETLKVCRQKLSEKLTESTMLTYGPDHPQAK